MEKKKINHTAKLNREQIDAHDEYPDYGKFW